MKKVLLGLIVCMVFIMTSGCVTSTVTEPFVYTNNINTEFEILGTFEHRSTHRAGYVEIYNIARRIYPETDFVIDIMIDKHTITTSYHFFVFLLRQLFGAGFGKTVDIRYEYVMRGTAIRYTNVRYASQPVSTAPAGTMTINPITAPEQQSPAVTQPAATINYTVQNVTGQVQFQRNFQDAWSNVSIGDVFTRDIRIRTAISASVVLSDGSRNITIPGGREGRIDSLIGLN